jgi:hypothetical protein
VIRELSAEKWTTFSVSPAKNIGTGASRMIDAFPALCGSVDPANASPVS